MAARALLTLWFCLQLLGAVPSQGALFRKQGDLWQVPAQGAGLRSAVETLLAGPTPRQRNQGITTRIPGGSSLISLRQHNGAVWITLSAGFLAVPAARLEDAVEQITKTVLRSGPYRTAFLSVQDDSGQSHRLTDLLQPLPAPLPARPSSSPPDMATTGTRLWGGPPSDP
ncbi:MAG: GerMN domain-containing protein [Planctomycetota bacterium]|jgi:hypothetical protein